MSVAARVTQKKQCAFPAAGSRGGKREGAMASAYMSEAALRRRAGTGDLADVTELSLRGGEKVGRILQLENLDALKGLRSLDVSNNLLSSLSPLGAAGAPALTSLDASGNRLSSLDGLQPLGGSLRSLVLRVSYVVSSRVSGYLAGRGLLVPDPGDSGRAPPFGGVAARVLPVPPKEKFALSAGLRMRNEHVKSSAQTRDSTDQPQAADGPR